MCEINFGWIEQRNWLTYTSHTTEQLSILGLFQGKTKKFKLWKRGCNHLECSLVIGIGDLRCIERECGAGDRAMSDRLQKYRQVANVEILPFSQLQGKEGNAPKLVTGGHGCDEGRPASYRDEMCPTAQGLGGSDVRSEHFFRNNHQVWQVQETEVREYMGQIVGSAGRCIETKSMDLGVLIIGDN